MDRTSLEKLRIPELKARCKELKLTSYSKLTKHALVDKLLASASTTNLAPALPSSVSTDPAPPATLTKDAASSASYGSIFHQDMLAWPDDGEEIIDDAGAHAQNVNTAHTPVLKAPVVPAPPSAPAAASKHTTDRPSKPTKLKRPDVTGPDPIAPDPTADDAAASAGVSSSKRLKQTKAAPLVPAFAGPRTSWHPLASSPRPQQVEPATPSARLFSPEPIVPLPSSTAASSVLRPLPTRTLFRPPIPSKPSQPTISVPITPTPTNMLKAPALSPDSPVLSFAPAQDDPTVVRRITLPPPLRSREKVHRLALSFSALEEPERGAVARSGKIGRYAVFLSAYHRLRRFFSGARLLAFLSQPSIDPSMSNLWPYLLDRQREADGRLAAVQASWLGRLWTTESLRLSTSKRPFDAVASALYASPDDPRQLSIALRAVVARLHTALATARGEDLVDGALGQVVGAKAVVDGIWRVDFVRPSVEPSEYAATAVWESAFVLEATGEPLGREPSSPILFATRPDDATLLAGLRIDWRNFLGLLAPPPVLSLVETSDDDGNFWHGIHSLWLAGQDASEERPVAERSILASSVLQSTSGTLLTSAQMHDAFYGWPASAASHSAADNPSSLPSCFLPSRHHVLSVELSAVALSGLPLHPSLAVVHLAEAAEPDYVLRETGQVVGGGLDGVSELWQGLLGCDDRGLLSRRV